MLSNSILMIGPMGAGKSTISSLMSSTLNMPKISLDDRNRLGSLYSKRNEFNDLKDFEFYLTCSVLTGLKEPTIIDFGAGHSVYENPIMFYEFKKLISRFSNVVYMITSENKEESIEILNQRILKRNPNEPISSLESNRHFVNMPCNKQLSTIQEFTNGKTKEEISNELLYKIKNKDDKNQSDLDGFHHKL